MDKNIELLSNEELLELNGGVSVMSEETQVAGLQGWNNCCNVAKDEKDK